MIYKATILFFLIGSIWAQEKSISGSTRRNRFSAGKSQAVDFNCPEDFGYYSHPSDCSQYYVCVFGGALLESCTGGLMYSTELQTCDWPRNVVCQTSTGPGVSTVKITDPRTQSRNTNTNAIHSATESLTSSSSILSRGIDNTIRTRQTPKSQGTSKSIFDDPSKGRQGRFLSNQGNDPQRIDNGFQAQETSSRAFNVVPSAPAPKVKFPPSLPGTSSGNRFSPARSSTKSPPQDSLYQDLLNLNDTDYYYYYDDILYDDYYDANSAKNKPTTTTTTASPFVRSRTPARSRGKASSKKSVSQSSLPSSSLTSRGRDSSRSSVSNTFKSPSSLKSNNPTSSFSSFPNAFSPSRSTGSKRGSSTSSTSKAGRKTQASSSKSAPRLSTNRHSLNQNTESASTALPPTLLPIPLIPSNKSKLNTSIPTKPSQNLSAITHKLKSSLKPNATSRSTSAKTKSNTVLPIGNDEENEIAKVKRLANVEKVKGDDFATNEVENSEVAERRKRPFPFATITVALMKNRGLSLRNGQKITPSSSLRNPFLRRSFNSTTTSKPTKIRNRNTGSARRRISSVNRSLKPNKTSPESNKGNISARRISPTASLPNRKTEIFTNRKLNISNEVISRISERLQVSEAKESLKNEETKGVHVIRKVTPVSKPMNVSSASNRNREGSKAPTTTESRTFTVPTPERVLLQRQPIGRAKTRTKSIRNPPSLLRSRISNNRKDLTNRASKFPVVPSNSRLPSTSSVLSNSRFQAKNRKEATVSKVESKSKTDLENNSDSSTSKIPIQSVPLKVVNIRNFSSSDETRNAIANAKLNPGEESEQNAANNKAKSITNSKLTQSLVPILVQTTNKNEDPKPVPEIKVSKRPIIPATSLSSTRSSSVKPIPTTDVLPKEKPSKQNTSSSQKKNRKPSPATVTFSQLRSPSFKLTNTSFKPVSEKFDIKSIPRDTTPRTILRPVITPRRPSISSSLKPTRNKPTIPKISETKDLNEASSNTSQETGLDRGSSRSKPKASSGSPKVVGRTPQRLVRPSKKPLPASSRSSLITDIWKYPPRRPNPLYPQPQVDVTAAPCDKTTCKLPDCYCGGRDIPGKIAPQNVPQMVLLTFDDSVNDLNKKLYIDLFEKGRVNPNGCPISATFYISHEWTDYSQVQNLYSDGHEIASHSITHSFGEQFSTTKWAKEIGGQREIMSAYGGVRMEDIRGMRAPFLAVGGNNMFRMLYDLNFTYDSSMPVYENNPPSWPYTLDYKIFHDCMIPPCPTNSYPGVWQVPMVMWQDLTGGRCSMGDACTTPPDAEGVYKMLIKNFERHYTTNRSPFGLFYHAAWFTTPHHKEGFIAFLDTISAMDDVWLVTNWQALQWVRDPTPLNRAKSFPPFQCDYPERPPRCTTPKVCNVWHKGSVRYLKTCYACPESYPWTGNTGVKSPLNDL